MMDWSLMAPVTVVCTVLWSTSSGDLSTTSCPEQLRTASLQSVEEKAEDALVGAVPFSDGELFIRYITADVI